MSIFDLHALRSQLTRRLALLRTRGLPESLLVDLMARLAVIEEAIHREALGGV